MRMTRLTTHASTGRRMKRSVKDFMRLAVAGLRRLFGFRSEFVVFDDAYAVAKFEEAGAGHLVAFFQPRVHADEIAFRASGADELLPYHQPFIAIGGGADDVD